MIRIQVGIPKEISKHSGDYKSKAKYRVEDNCKTEGSASQRYAFRRGHEHLKATLSALQEINCSAEIICEISGGTPLINGLIQIWNPRDRLLVEEIIASLEDIATNAGRLRMDAMSVIDFSLEREVTELC